MFVGREYAYTAMDISVTAESYKLQPIRPSGRGGITASAKLGYLLFFISKNPVIQFLQCMHASEPGHITFPGFLYRPMIHHSISGCVLMAECSEFSLVLSRLLPRSGAQRFLKGFIYSESFAIKYNLGQVIFIDVFCFLKF